ncbi:MAG: hypothetical protein Q8J97_07220, partial [Flavobacteriaceae bacterium]|nr:hypothetical protein [Flavobacteriaceae bacterium]
TFEEQQRRDVLRVRQEGRRHEVNLRLKEDEERRERLLQMQIAAADARHSFMDARRRQIERDNCERQHISHIEAHNAEIEMEILRAAARREEQSLGTKTHTGVEKMKEVVKVLQHRKDVARTDGEKRIAVMQLLKTLQFAQAVNVTHHPLTLAMLLAVLRARTADELTTKIHTELPTRAALYEAFLQLRVATSPAKVADVEAALTAMASVALAMLRTGRWATTVGAAKALLHKAATDADDATVSAWLRAVPSRVEDIEDDASAFTVWHKSLGEYLCARQLHRSPKEALEATATHPSCAPRRLHAHRCLPRRSRSSPWPAAATSAAAFEVVTISAYFEFVGVGAGWFTSPSGVLAVTSDFSVASAVLLRSLWSRHSSPTIASTSGASSDHGCDFVASSASFGERCSCRAHR